MGEKSILHHLIQTTEIILPLFNDAISLKEARIRSDKIENPNIV